MASSWSEMITFITPVILFLGACYRLKKLAGQKRGATSKPKEEFEFTVLNDLYAEDKQDVHEAFLPHFVGPQKIGASFVAQNEEASKPSFTRLRKKFKKPPKERKKVCSVTPI